MTKGRVTCEILKQIRDDIAKANQIEYAPEVCSFKGECAGTCPKCEQELQFLELQLVKKRRVNNPVAIAGVALGLMASITACNSASKSETKSNSTASPNLEVAHNDLHRDSLVVHNNDQPRRTIKNNKKNVKNISSLEIQEINESVLDSVRLPIVEIVSNYAQLTMCGGISGVPIKDKEKYPIKRIIKNIIYEPLISTPSFSDDSDSLVNYISQKFKYPEGVKIKKQILLVKFLVDPSGRISSVFINRPIQDSIDSQIGQILKNMPNWNPGRDRKGKSHYVIMKAKLKITPTEIKIMNLKKDGIWLNTY